MRSASTRIPAAAALLVLALAGAGAGCGSDGGSTSQPHSARRIDLVVGDMLPLTGPSAGLGASAQKAALLAVERVNDAIRQAQVDHALEIVHEDDYGDTPSAAARRLLASGAGCIIGPWDPAGIRALASDPAVRRRALLISPDARVPDLGGASRGSTVELPPRGRQRALNPHPPGGDLVASGAFARLFTSTDPPIGPARTSDARQFDAVIACYLAAVAAGSADSTRMAGRLGSGWGIRRTFSWQHLSDAIGALAAGKPIAYQGITARIGVRPRARTKRPAN